jgi:hypothetical protein
VELTGGLGRAVVLKLKELSYWNIFRDMKEPEIALGGPDARFGIETSSTSKPMMVGALQQFIRDNAIIIPDEETIGEMVAFEQERSPNGMTTRYRGAGGAPDDRVMSLAIGAGVAVSYPIFEHQESSSAIAKEIPKQYNDEWTRILSPVDKSDEDY